MDYEDIEQEEVFDEQQKYYIDDLKRKLNIAEKALRLFDKVKYNNIKCFITGRRTSGYFMLKTLDGTSIHNGIGFKHLRFIEPRNNYLTEVMPIPLVS